MEVAADVIKLGEGNGGGGFGVRVTLFLGFFCVYRVGF
jgi:hypothetical protein